MLYRCSGYLQKDATPQNIAIIINYLHETDRKVLGRNPRSSLLFYFKINRYVNIFESISRDYPITVSIKISFEKFFLIENNFLAKTENSLTIELICRNKSLKLIPCIFPIKSLKNCTDFTGSFFLSRKI